MLIKVSTLYLVMLSRKSSSMATPLEVVDTSEKGIVYECGAEWCITRVSQSSANPQRLYYCCPLLADDHGLGCGFFQWVSDKSRGPEVRGEESGKHPVQEIQSLLEKEMFAADSKKELCELGDS
ncbi:hypothetical protein Taro_013989 [Colocasia esculenta]|uniref:GRF-type domain-containing protein n=1 Tax=Colocasia esculenta TaxID=4460 RepID=A0A843UHP5_COLES|nr:hypothetical protein [Colocasia esculenta]